MAPHIQNRSCFIAFPDVILKHRLRKAKENIYKNLGSKNDLNEYGVTELLNYAMLKDL